MTSLALGQTPCIEDDSTLDFSYMAGGDFREIFAMTDPAIFNHAVFAHAKWKYRLRQAIETGKSDWTVDEVRDGHWLACDDVNP